MCKIKVVDAICGSRKTESMINFINNQPYSRKFLYITPFLTEVERIKTSCSKRFFKEPIQYKNKIDNIKTLFSNGENIVSTHALFRMFDDEILKMVKTYNYTLIMDEVADVIDLISISNYDLDTLLEKYVDVKQDGTVVWTALDYEGAFEKYKKLCFMGSIRIYKKNSGTPCLIWMFPTELFTSFQEVYILTYLFDAQVQKYYYDFNNIEYEKLYIKGNQITKEFQKTDMSKYRKLIEICENERMNSIGEVNGSLSSSWYTRNKYNKPIISLKNNCINYFKHISRTPSRDNMWTTFKEYKEDIKGKGYSKGFVGVNIRATNEYIEKKSIAYLCNRYINPIIKNFFELNNIYMDEDLFALSEMVQLIFRSAIRRGENINIYIPSFRMREILKKWLNNEISC